MQLTKNLVCSQYLQVEQKSLKFSLPIIYDYYLYNTKQHLKRST